MREFLSGVLDELAWRLRRQACRFGRHRVKFNGGDARCVYCSKERPPVTVELPPDRKDQS